MNFCFQNERISQIIAALQNDSDVTNILGDFHELFYFMKNNQETIQDFVEFIGWKNSFRLTSIQSKYKLSANEVFYLF